MNKDILGRLVAKNHALSYVDETIFLKAMIKDFMALIDELEQKVEILEEKATPKKVVDIDTYIDFEEGYTGYSGICPTCREWCYSNHDSCYCCGCGQALDWSEEDVD